MDALKIIPIIKRGNLKPKEFSTLQEMYRERMNKRCQFSMISEAFKKSQDLFFPVN